MSSAKRIVYILKNRNNVRPRRYCVGLSALDHLEQLCSERSR
jgi:hypothetical protein